MTQTLLVPTVIDWKRDASVCQHERADTETDTRERSGRRSIAGHAAAGLGHAVRAVLHALIEGLAQHGAAHHCFPPHRQDDSESHDA